MARQDIKIQDNTPEFTNGDFAIGESDEQHVIDTINAFPGWWKEYPQEGVGIRSWIGSPGNRQEVQRAIRIALEADGYSADNPSVEFLPNGELKIAPNATI